MPAMSRLRALRGEPEDIPVSESSVAFTAPPRSGSAKVHPYNPVSEAIEGSSFEYVPELPVLPDSTRVWI